MPKVVCIWELSSEECNNIPDNIKIVKPFSLKAYYYKSRSKVIVDNSVGYISKQFTFDSEMKKKLYVETKKKKQVNISTWHGTPLKHIFLDVKDSDIYNDFFTTSDVIILSDSHTAKVLNKACYGKVPIKKLGSPRNDILINRDDNLKKYIKNKLKLPTDKKIVLYAPTFRSSKESQNSSFSSGTDYLNSIKLGILFENLERKFDGKWTFVLRVHPAVAESIDLQSLEQEIGGKVYNGNLGDEMSEYLLVSDILITDYSSSMFDYALTKKPCFLFCPDLENYRDFERGLYFDITKLPFPLSTDFTKLIAHINEHSQYEYEKDLNYLLNMLGNVDDGSSTIRTIRLIMTILNGDKINDEVTNGDS